MDLRPSQDITSDNRGEPLRVVGKLRFVRVIVVDLRPGYLKRQFELEGKMVIPQEVCEGNVITNWAFDELLDPMMGVVTDAQAEGVNIVFPIVHENNAMASDRRDYLSFEEIRSIFIRDNPRLNLVRDN